MSGRVRLGETRWGIFTRCKNNMASSDDGGVGTKGLREMSLKGNLQTLVERCVKTVKKHQLGQV